MLFSHYYRQCAEHLIILKDRNGNRINGRDVEVQPSPVVIEVPVTRIVEKVVEIPKVEIQERIVEVPKLLRVPIEIREVEKVVEVPVTETIVKIIEVPIIRERVRVVQIPKVVEVPVLQIRTPLDSEAETAASEWEFQ